MTLVSGSLAAYRMAQLVSIDDGPMRIFARIRQQANQKASMEQISMRGKFGPWQSLADGLHCPYCVGIWFSFLLVALSILDNRISDFVLTALAVAGAQSLLQGNRNAE